jgi:hypothetical protein
MRFMHPGRLAGMRFALPGCLSGTQSSRPERSPPKQPIANEEGEEKPNV